MEVCCVLGEERDDLKKDDKGTFRNVLDSFLRGLRNYFEVSKQDGGKMCLRVSDMVYGDFTVNVIKLCF